MEYSSIPKNVQFGALMKIVSSFLRVVIENPISGAFNTGTNPTISAS